MKEYKMKINGNDYAVTVSNVEDNMALVNVNGTEYQVEVEGMASAAPKTPKLVQQPTVDAAPATARTASPAKTAGVAAGHVKSPLPGVILDILVREGDAVKVGQTLLVLEAMKMENNIDSDRDGVVKEVKVRRGDSVLEGDILVTIG